MHPQLQSVADEIRAAMTRAERLAARATPDEWHRPPGPGRWSAAECVAHLNLTADAYLPILDAGLAEAERHGAGFTGHYRRDVVGWLLWRSVAEGGHVKSRTTAPFVPPTGPPAEAALADFRRLHEALLERVARADGRCIHRVRIPSAFNPALRYSLWSAFTIIARHAHRHLRQAEVAAGLA